MVWSQLAAADASYSGLRALEQPELDPDPVDIIGFDLGHGDTSVARVHALGGEAMKLEILKGSKTVVTAVAKAADGGILIGRNAYRGDAMGLTHQFKSSQVTERAVYEPLRLFVRATVGKLRENNSTIPFDRTTLFVFGCPSAWSDPERLAYGRALAKEVPDSQTMLVRESRAAFITMKEARQLSIEQLRESILIVDLGSSTTDFTFSKNLVPEELPIGREWPLGASRIERQLVELAMQSCPDSEAIREWWKKQPSEYHRTVWEFRQRKEEFFSDEEAVRSGGSIEARVVYFIAEGKKVRLEADLTAEIFMKALDVPMELGPKPVSWRARLRSDLEAARDTVLSRVGVQPAYVILTGGAARMDFVLKLAKEVFRAPVHVVRAPEPEHAISVGLAHAGSIHFRTRSFRLEIQELIASTAVEDIITRRTPEFANTVARAVAHNFTSAFILPCFVAWRNADEGKLRHVIADVSTRMKNWAESDEGRKAMLVALKDWYTAIEKELHEITSKICLQWNLPADALDIPRDLFSPNRTGNLASADDLVFGSARPIMSAVLATISFVVGVILFGSGTAMLLHTGPLAPLITGLFLWLIGEAGKKVLIEKVTDMEIPGWIRRRYPESWLKSGILKRASEIDLKVREAIRMSIVGGYPEDEPEREDKEKEAESNRDQIMKRVTRGIEEALELRAEEASLLIR